MQAALGRYGFIDTTKKDDKAKGKLESRRGRSSQTVIYFDYQNFQMFEKARGRNAFETHSVITADDLHLLLWYVVSNRADREEISDRHFDLHLARNNYKIMVSLLRYAREFNHSTWETKRFERLLNKHDAIQLD